MSERAKWSELNNRDGPPQELDGSLGWVDGLLCMYVCMDVFGAFDGVDVLGIYSEMR